MKVKNTSDYSVRLVIEALISTYSMEQLQNVKKIQSELNKNLGLNSDLALELVKSAYQIKFLREQDLQSDFQSIIH